MLATEPGHRIPAGVEQDEQRLDAMPRRNTNELRETFLEASGILRPELIVQEDPHCVESVVAGPAQFGVDATRVVGAGLEHLELIDRGRGGEVGADWPTLRLIPRVGAISRPPVGLRRRARGVCGSAR